MSLPTGMLLAGAFAITAVTSFVMDELHPSRRTSLVAAFSLFALWMVIIVSLGVA